MADERKSGGSRSRGERARKVRKPKVNRLPAAIGAVIVVSAAAGLYLGFRKRPGPPVTAPAGDVAPSPQSIESPQAPPAPAGAEPGRPEDREPRERGPALVPAEAPPVAEAARSADAVRAVKLETEPPTLHCLGFRWYVSGDANADATVEVSFRPSGEMDWRKAVPLRRIEVEALEERRPPAGQCLFAGSILFLAPDTEYDVRLELKDPDGGEVVEELRQRTWAEPVAPAPRRTLHVAPGSGGGSGTAADPFRGLATADARSRPGDLILVHKGVYPAPLSITKSGTPEAPIVWRGPAAPDVRPDGLRRPQSGRGRGAGDGEAVIDGAGKGIAVRAYGRRHVFLEGITIRRARYGVHLNGSRDLTVRRCHFDRVGTGVFGDAVEHRVFICDNLIEGIELWPKPKGHKSGGYRGVELSGTGSVVCYNTIHNFRDGVDVRTSWPIRAIDIHNNEISECSDDGIELDFSEHNTRAYFNRVTNVLCGVSFQPIRGGPAYAVRNVFYNVGHEIFKLHLTPTNRGSPNWEEGPHRTSGGVMIHNTVVKTGPPFRVWSNEGPAHHFYVRNNLFVGATGGNAIEITCPVRRCDLDYDAYVSGGQGFGVFAFWNKRRYRTIRDFAEQTGQERHGQAFASHAGIFASEVKIPEKKVKYEPQDLRLSAGSPVIDGGVLLPGMNDEFTGKGPDLGALEYGAPPPRYGARPQAQRRP